MSLLIKNTTKEERMQIVRRSMDCGGGCENCSSCWLLPITCRQIGVIYPNEKHY